MIKHINVNDEEVRRQIKHKQIVFAGNIKLKIYGTLHCKSGKRMKRENRIFFISEEEAIQNNFRACKHCMKYKYL
jgi:methylphosphotriester-DNA--protein-cysteine methyltransferase